jgi:geranylgeranyl pyrophosphate synthase
MPKTTRSRPAARAALPPPFEADRRAVDRYLTRRLARLPGVPARLARAMRHAALAPGKRIRPLLVLLGYDAVGGERKARAAMLPAAAALEFVHAFSLAHDDLPALDDDDLRRGRPTLHKQFDEATAILAGDALLALAFEELAATLLVVRDPRRVAMAVFEVATATGPAGMIGGQVLDLAAEGRWGQAAARHGRTKAGVTAIHVGKTGRLLAAALVVGGCLGGGDARQLGALEAIGLDLGLAFQVADDLLNEKGDARTLGKNAGTDRARGKATYPRAVGASQASRALSTLTARAVRRAEVFPRIAGRFATLAALLAARQA